MAYIYIFFKHGTKPFRCYKVRNNKSDCDWHTSEDTNQMNREVIPNSQCQKPFPPTPTNITSYDAVSFIDTFHSIPPPSLVYKKFILQNWKNQETKTEIINEISCEY